MELNKKELATSFFHLVLRFVFELCILGTNNQKPRLYDGSINELGRYSFTFDAYEYIDENSEKSNHCLGQFKDEGNF